MNIPSFFASCIAAASLSFAAERALEPLKTGEDSVRVWTIEAFHTARSADERVGVSIVAEVVGHTYNPVRLLATFKADGPVEGEYVDTTAFDLGTFETLEPPKLIDRINDRLYRLSFVGSFSDTIDAFTTKFSYDIHLAEDGSLARVVPVKDYSSYWDMDGSTMGLVAAGALRSIYYVDPKPGSGVKPGTPFFHGTKDGDAYRGKLPGGDDSRDAEGEVRNDGATVVLKLRAVEWKDGGKVPVDPETSHILRFKSKVAPKP